MITTLSSRKIALFLGFYFGFLAIMASANYYMGYYSARPDTSVTSDEPSYYALPRLSINIGAVGGAARLGISLQVAAKDLVALKSYVPRIMDRIQSYMQNVLVEDFKNVGSLNWLRGDLLTEVNAVSGPVHVLGIVFREVVL